MPQIDKMVIEILADGTIKTHTANFISKANHDNAEAFIRNMAQLAGGETTREKLEKADPRRLAQTARQEEQSEARR
jgi:hypothetical protein